jgi:hypothetical protein
LDGQARRAQASNIAVFVIRERLPEKKGSLDD